MDDLEREALNVLRVQKVREMFAWFSKEFEPHEERQMMDALRALNNLKTSVDTIDSRLSKKS